MLALSTLKSLRKHFLRSPLFASPTPASSHRSLLLWLLKSELPGALGISLAALLDFLRTGQVHFVGNHKPGARRQGRIVQINFPAQIPQIFDRTASLASGDIHHENQNAAARNVTQKFMTQPESAVRSFDQTRNIRDRGASVTWKFNDADNRMKRRKWVGRDLRSRGRNFP